MLAHIAFATLALIPLVSGKGSGPPVSTVEDLCTTMAPKHIDVEEQPMSALPYNLSTSSSCFKESGIVQVTISVLKNPHDITYFKGFLMMAKKMDEMDDAYGRFELGSNDDMKVQLLQCFDKINSAIGHKNKPELASATFTWIAPYDLMEDVNFVATIALSREEYWMNVKAPLKYDPYCGIDREDMEMSGGNAVKAGFAAMIVAFIFSLVM